MLSIVPGRGRQRMVHTGVQPKERGKRAQRSRVECRRPPTWTQHTSVRSVLQQEPRPALPSRGAGSRDPLPPCKLGKGQNRLVC